MIEKVIEKVSAELAAASVCGLRHHPLRLRRAGTAGYPSRYADGPSSQGPYAYAEACRAALEARQ
jgi:hypothetical protein